MAMLHSSALYFVVSGYCEVCKVEKYREFLTIPLLLEQVYEFVQLAELYYAGSHGMDIMGPAKNSDGFRVKGTKYRDKKVLPLLTA